MMNNIIKIPNFKEVVYCVIKSQKYIVLKRSEEKINYFSIPKDVNFTWDKTKEELTFIPKEANNDYTFFHKIVTDYIRSFERNTKKTLFLKGLGFKMNFSPDNKKIEFKLGYSNTVSIDYPEDLIISIDKNKIVVEGEDKCKVGNFAHKIRSLKKPDPYKGKGFWYKYEKEVLKPVKKK
jgi:ribosomal protein L6P/L9E